MRLELTKRAVKDLDALERAQPKTFSRILAKIQSLPLDPRAGKPLVGPLKGKWSLRVGDHRIIYELDNQRIIILTINHRREVYR
ncbi:MAG: type II toxin-antitoxin system RelE/ParE family toxin [Bacteroidota bacterium]